MPFRTRRDILPPGQKKLWPRLAPSRVWDIACTGNGAGPALRPPPVDGFRFLHRPHARQEGAGNDSSLVPERNRSSGGTGYPRPPCRRPRSKGKVKVSFFAGLRIGRVGIPQLSDDGVVLVASVRDLLATKLKALFDRVEPKDYLDIAEILSRGNDLLQGLSDARALFGKTFSPAECLRTLCWFGEPGLGSLPAGCRRTLETA